MSDIAFLPAVELAHMVRDREIGCSELLELYLERVETHNPALNAIIVFKTEEARRRAAEADTALARGEVWGPLHGVPMTVKESFDWVGTPSTWGNPVYKDNVAAVDSVAVQRLQDAGAVIFGKTNVPLMLADWQSFNAIYGTTNNPWDLSRTPGGSSGGSAAALAAGLCGLEIGSDIGASIRNPAHYCGLFGHKPTYGIVPLRGHLLPGAYGFADISVAGPLARSAEDLAVALDVLAGPEGLDAAGWRLELPAARQGGLKDFKVAVMLSSPCCAQDDELTDQLQDSVDALARAGVQVNEKAFPDIDVELAHHDYIMLLRAATATRLPDEEFQKHLEGAARRTPEDCSYPAYVDRAVTLHHRDWWALHNERERMRLEWGRFFAEYDLLLCPTAASAAFPHDHEGERADRTIPVNGGQESTTDQLFWAGLPGVVYLPAAVAPAGLTRSGLPCGLQMIGGHLQDRTCLAFAALMERELGGFVAPPGYH